MNSKLTMIIIKLIALGYIHVLRTRIRAAKRYVHIVITIKQNRMVSQIKSLTTPKTPQTPTNPITDPTPSTHTPYPTADSSRDPSDSRVS